MSKPKKKLLCVEASGSTCFINISQSSAQELHLYLRSHGVRSAPPEPSYTGFDRIELGKGVDPQQVQRLLDAWR